MTNTEKIAEYINNCDHEPTLWEIQHHTDIDTKTARRLMGLGNFKLSKNKDISIEEKLVLDLVKDGLSNKEISLKTGFDYNKVSTIKSKMVKKGVLAKKNRKEEKQVIYIKVTKGEFQGCCGYFEDKNLKDTYIVFRDCRPHRIVLKKDMFEVVKPYYEEG